MLEQLIGHLEQQLSEHGDIVEVIMRTEQSLIAEEETHEVELLFAENEEAVQAGKPTATIHVFPLEKGLYEVEVEVTYDCQKEKRDPQKLLAAGQQIVAEMTLVEKTRYLEPGKAVEKLAVLAFHFIVEMPSDEEQAHYQKLLGKWAADTGKLLLL
ncbi:hypothetical protein ACTID9_19605 [Brevibacillus fluminis]|uniref:hypothetical protein n=1 Tax=Brevibacillus fluminis TaxID=511487 RepID=UPI003F8AC39F